MTGATTGTGWVTGRPKRFRALRHVVLTIVAIPWVLLPLWVLVVNSFKSESDASTPDIDLPKQWAIGDNYRTVIQDGQYFTGLRNSALVAIPVIIAVLLLGSMAAWTFARTTSKWLRPMFYVMALSVILPPAIIPTVVLLNKTGLTSSVLGYILALIGTRIGIIVFLVTGYIRGLPVAFEDAAQIDGANSWRVFWHVILPLLRPVLFTAAVMTVINVWNDFLFALYMVQGSSNATLPLTLYTFASAGQYGVRWNLVFAFVVLSSLPLLILYIVLQRRIVSGLTEGGVTG